MNDWLENENKDQLYCIMARIANALKNNIKNILEMFLKYFKFYSTFSLTMFKHLRISICI